MTEVIKVNGKEYGRVKDDVFLKHVDSSKHKLRKPSGWAIDENVLGYIKDDGVVEIMMVDYKNNITCRTSVDKFMEYGIHIDRGYGSQIALPDRYWE
jgi:hypothetical protein